MTDPRDLVHLERCIALAAQVLEAGDDPFGATRATNRALVAEDVRGQSPARPDRTGGHGRTGHAPGQRPAGPRRWYARLVALRHLDAIIAGLRPRGYRLVTVTDLLASVTGPSTTASDPARPVLAGR